MLGMHAQHENDRSQCDPLCHERCNLSSYEAQGRLERIQEVQQD